MRGLRTLVSILLSVLLPLGLLFVLGFLASLPFTGLDMLWATRHATSLLLRAAAVLVVLVTATYHEHAPHRAQNWAVVGNERWLLPQCLTRFNAQCEAVLLDLNGDGRDEVALLDPADSSAAITFEQGPDGTWRTIGALSGPLTCKAVLAALRDGTFSLVPPPWREVDAGGLRLQFQPDQEPAGDSCSNP